MGFLRIFIICCFLNLFLLGRLIAFLPECIQHSKYQSLSRTFFKLKLFRVADTILLLHVKTFTFLMSILAFCLSLYCHYFLVKFHLNLTLSSGVPGFFQDLIMPFFEIAIPNYSYLHPS